MQGFNTGVVLYNLAKMRVSKEYNKYISERRMVEMVERYELESTLAEQDWFTLLGWEKPELFHLLPCEYNLQTDVEYRKNSKEVEQLWDTFRNCNEEPKIIHSNGSI